MIDVLRFVFYLTIAIPFIYMFFDVFHTIYKALHQLYSRQMKPIIVQIATSLSKM
jgi:hypothetical protein